jgi:hypothetical protein
METRWPVFTRPPLAAFEVTPEAHLGPAQQHINESLFLHTVRKIPVVTGRPEDGKQVSPRKSSLLSTFQAGLQSCKIDS